MLKVTETQRIALRDAREAGFAETTRRWLREGAPDWAAPRNDAEIDAHVREMRAFAERHGLRSAAAVQRLAMLRAQGRWQGEASAWAMRCLTRRGNSEARRVDDFRDALALGDASPRVIGLDGGATGAAGRS